MWVASILMNVGMWCERFNIVITSLHRDFLPSKWENYMPTWVDISLFAAPSACSRRCSSCSSSSSRRSPSPR